MFYNNMSCNMSCNNPSKSDSVLVREFTLAAGQLSPNHPLPMNKEEVFFLVKMMLDEIMELCATVSTSEEYKYNMIKMITNSRDHNVNFKQFDHNEIIAEQVDALVDAYYYSLNAMAKKGVNFSHVFNLVHQANMNKRDQESGLFLKREDGKIIKPDGWVPPNIKKEIERQHIHGSFMHKHD